MKVANITMKPGYLILKNIESEDATTKSGLILEENTDDFIVHAEVVNSSGKYGVGEHVIYYVLDTNSMRDGVDAYSMIHEDKILGTYAIEEESEK